MLCQSKADVQDCKKIDYKVKKNQPNKKKSQKPTKPQNTPNKPKPQSPNLSR